MRDNFHDMQAKTAQKVLIRVIEHNRQFPIPPRHTQDIFQAPSRQPPDTFKTPYQINDRAPDTH